MEEQILSHPCTRAILSHFPKGKIVTIRRYPDLFNRPRQNLHQQQQSVNLILAEQKKGFLYPGAPVCQSFGNPSFYYSASVMNCLFQCDYCFLKGMYPSRNLVIFVNLEDTFQAVREKLLTDSPLYLCVSYDTDLISLEPITGFASRWADFARKTGGLSIELRTKAGEGPAFQKLLQSCRNDDSVIFAFTISPEKIIQEHERGTASLMQRLSAVSKAQSCHVPVRLCFDPMIYVPDWKETYGEMLRILDQKSSWKNLLDVSVGSFRISTPYLKQLRTCEPESSVVQFPFVSEKGYSFYPDQIRIPMESWMKEQLLQRIPLEKIFLWEDTQKSPADPKD